MKSNQQSHPRIARLWTLITVGVIVLLGCSQDTLAQWTTPNGSGNINNTNTGKVGIGTTTPVYSLDLNGGTNAFRTKASTSSSNDTIATFENSSSIVGIIRANGFFGIGTTSPTTALEVGRNAAGTASGLTITGGSTIAAPVLYFNYADAGANLKRWMIFGDINGGFSIATQPDAGGVASQKLFVSNAGNVGIGTTSPGSLLALQKDQATGTEIRVTNNNSAGFAGMYLNGGFATTSGGFLQYNNTSGFKNLFLGTGGAEPLHLGTENTVRLTIVPGSGNVGIGTPTPNALYRLDVAGKVNTSTGFCINGDCKTAWSEIGGASSQWTTTPTTTKISYNSGNVGVGTSDPLFSLDVNGGTNAFRAKASTSGSGDAIASFENSSGIVGIMRANGNFGIGTVNPGSLLAVQKDQATGTEIRVTNNNSAGFAGVYLNGGFATTAGGFLQYNNNVANKNLFVATGGPDPLHLGTGNAIRVTVLPNSGNVGVGTTAPTEKLEVSGNLKLTGTGNLTAAGTIEGFNIKAKYQDLAEWVDSSQELDAGTVVVLDSDKSNHVIASTKSYDSSIAGVISLQPGLILGEGGEGRVLVATTGRVKVKVDASNGPIAIGDLLVTSDKEGIAMKSVAVDIGGVRFHRPGTLIGKALEPLAKGTGEILVLLSLQ